MAFHCCIRTRASGEGLFSRSATPILERINGLTWLVQVERSSRSGLGKRWHCEQMFVASDRARSKRGRERLVVCELLEKHIDKPAAVSSAVEYFFTIPI